MKRSCNSRKKIRLVAIVLFGLVFLLFAESCSNDRHDVYCFKNGGCFTVINENVDESKIIPGAYPEGPYPNDNYITISGIMTIFGNIYHGNSRADTMTMLVVQGSGTLVGDFSKFGIRVDTELTFQKRLKFEDEMKDFVCGHLLDTVESYYVTVSHAFDIQEVRYEWVVLQEKDTTFGIGSGPFRL